MASVDDIFKKPALPSSKRKLEVSHDPSQYYKSAKTVPNGDAKGKMHAASVEEEDEDMEAGPAAPPDDEEEGDYGPDDEEGRFFGGGVDEGTTAALDFLDAREKEEVFVEEKYDVGWLRKLSLNFEKRISKNAELRAKYEEDPSKFMASEADLDADIKTLSILSEHPELYPEFARLGCVNSLVSLLAHENTDIAIDAIEIIAELIDEDVAAEPEQWDSLVSAALESDLLDLLVSNFSRFDESQESDRSGVYNSLSILESLASQPTLASSIGQSPKIFEWLLNRIQILESPLKQNKQYAAEILAILLQTSTENRIALTKLNGVDVLLQLLAPYRRRDPQKDSEEEEYVENVFDALSCLVDEPAGKDEYIKAEGIELCLIMLREGKMSKPRALTLLDHAVSGAVGLSVCEKLVEAQGLKTIFGMFMKKIDKEMVEHILGIFAALLRSLPGESAERIRVLAKFVEKDYAKLEKIVTLRRDYVARLSGVDAQIKLEKKGLSKEEQADSEDEFFSRRLDAGLYCLQTIDVVLAWLVAEDGGARKKVIKLMSERDEGLADIKKTLQEQVQGITDENDEAKASKDMLSTLVDFLS
jgi:beta-catenin-like protein 1